jgi:uncharacterized membrane protein (UPF0127 family)
MVLLSIGDVLLQAEVADTDGSRHRGLSGRPGLAQGEGMFFVFPSAGYWGMWMKDMRFAIDILWVDSGGTNVHIESNVSPATYPQVFEPPAPARYVLELPAGFAAARGIAEGMKVVVR